ncbi:MAG: UDP-N-acetyl-2-amino-2-deoxyglucuronate dehydrogenase [Cryomorphaceae bacterium]|jgi:UDP-N-acetyl-2-amino-2-deoxyglucuronate dehydrogenase
MKFGIVGTGMIANFHAKAIEAMEGSSLHSCFDRNLERSSEFAEKNEIKTYATLDEFLADPELDIITIGTPSGTHLEPALAGMNAGKHVICEKPLEVTPERIDPLIAASEINGVTLAAILNRRFNESVVKLKEAVDAGRFGTISLVEASIKWYRDQAYYDSAGWRGTWALDGGGALMNQSVHIIDQLIHTIGPVKRVTGSMALLAHENIEVEDTAVAILEFENGAKGIVQGSTACWSSTGHPAEVNICGSEGSAFLADEHFKVWDFKTPAPVDEYVHANLMASDDAVGLGANDPNAINFTGHQRNFEEVVNAINENRRPSVDCHEARKAVAVICAIYESARDDGKWVTVS